MTLRFRASGNYLTRHVATINAQHVVTKDRFGFSGGGNRTYATFECTCGWKDRTVSGVTNRYAEAHARAVAREAQQA